MLLVFDIGNTNMVLGVYDGDNLVRDWRINTDLNKTSDEYGVLIKSLFDASNISLGVVDAIIVSSVVPAVMHSLENFCRKYCNISPMVVGPGIKTGLNIKCESPREVGSDRIIKAVAATRKYTGNIIIVSASSITTVDYINAKKEFLGGLILPGINLLQDSLVRGSAKLPHVELKRPDDIVGKNTEKAIQAGLFFAYKKAVLGIIDEIVEGYSLNKEGTNILITGPYAHLLDLSKYDLIRDDDLGIYGLKIIYDLNKKKAS